MGKKYFLILALLCFYLASFEPILAQRVIKFGRIGQKETVKVGEKYKIIYDNINPENSRIRYIPTARDDEYILELTHYKGLEGDEWIDDTIKKYESDIQVLKKQYTDLLNENNNLKSTVKQNIATNLQQDANSKKNEDKGNIDNNESKIEEINIKKDLNNSLIKSLTDSLRSLGKGQGNNSKIESLLKRINDLVEDNNNLNNEKIRILQAQHLQEEEIAEQKKLLNIFIIISIFILFLAIIIYYFYRQKKFANKIIFMEQQKSEKLLLNVLPPTIANRLKNGETTIADHFDEASIVFIDIVEFTRTTASVEPKRVVTVLNELYTKLDSIADKHGLEKIKTIGDCYMAAAGIPEIRIDNSIMAAKFAIEAMKTIEDYDTGGGLLINFRCGIDCGPVVAGVIGEKKFIYDIWGDTVNTASRMEIHGEPGRIHVTSRFRDKLTTPYPLLSKEGKEDGVFKGWLFEDRGDIEIKGKGMMRTWFMNSKS